MPNSATPDPQSTVTWLRLTFEDLDSIKPGSALAKKVAQEAVGYESAWRPAYVNAVERLVINPAMMVDEDAPITEPVDLDGEDGAYVMCWQFIPHKSVIPPEPDTPEQIQKMLERAKAVANKLKI